MAKKDLHSLMSGIIGSDNNSDSPVETQNIASSQLHNSAISKPGPGRPKKNTADNDDTRSTFIVSAELLRKIKYISLMDDRLLKDVVNDAFSLFVSQWEAENYKIKMPKK